MPDLFFFLLFPLHSPLIFLLLDLTVLLVENVPPRLSLVLIESLFHDAPALVVDLWLEAHFLSLILRFTDGQRRSPLTGVACQSFGGWIDIRVKRVPIKLLR